MTWLVAFFKKFWNRIRSWWLLARIKPILGPEDSGCCVLYTEPVDLQGRRLRLKEDDASRAKSRIAERACPEFQMFGVNQTLLPKEFRDLPVVSTTVLECDDKGILFWSGMNTWDREPEGKRHFILAQYLARPVYRTSLGTLANVDVILMGWVLRYLIHKDLLAPARLGDVVAVQLSPDERGERALLMAYVFAKPDVTREDLNAAIGFGGFIDEGGMPDPWPDAVVQALAEKLDELGEGY